MPRASASTLAATLLTLLRRLESGWSTTEDLARAVSRSRRRTLALLDDLRAAGAVIEREPARVLEDACDLASCRRQHAEGRHYRITGHRHRLVRRWE